MAETTRHSRYFPLGFGRYVSFAVTSGPPIIWRPRVALDRAESDTGAVHRAARVLCIGIGWWIFYVGAITESGGTR